MAEPQAVRGAGDSGTGRLTCGDIRWSGRVRQCSTGTVSLSVDVVVRALHTHLDMICAAPGEHPYGIDSRLDNIEAATLRARRLGARVLIW